MAKPPDKKTDLTIPTRAADQLGVAVARFRLQARLSQVALAKSAGLRQATVSKVERGAPNAEIKTIYAICAALGLELVVRPRETKVFRPEEFF